MSPSSKTFRDGDEIVLHAKASKDCYVNVLNILSNDQVILLFPNSYDSDNRLFAGKDFEWPTKRLRNRGVRFRVNLPKDTEQATEMLLVVATRDSVGLDFATSASDSFTALDYQTTLNALNHWLIRIPREERVEDTYQYQIVR